MLTEIALENFKCFETEIEIPLRKLNLFTGINGRGKSTVLQALLLMRQSLEHSRSTQQIIFNGSCVNLGNFDDVRNSNTSRSEPIYFTFIYQDADSRIRTTYWLSENEQDEMVANIDQVDADLPSKPSKKYLLSLKPSRHTLYSVYDRDTGTPYFELYWDNLSVAYDNEDEDAPEEIAQFIHRLSRIDFRRTHYISADRLGPQDYYPKQSFADFPNVGIRGEFTANVISKKKDEQVNTNLCLETGSTKTLLDQTEAWLDYIFGGGRLTLDQPHANIVLMALNAERSIHSYKPVNVGFGYSYALPIIVSGLVAKSGERLIVENPEAHLHPYAQSQLAKFLARVSATGVQIFIESHSDHVLNALRVAILDEIIEHTDLNVLYFDRNASQTVEQIPVNADGSIEHWPTGFFDQTDKDFERLFGV